MAIWWADEDHLSPDLGARLHKAILEWCEGSINPNRGELEGYHYYPCGCLLAFFRNCEEWAKVCTWHDSVWDETGSHPLEGD